MAGAGAGLPASIWSLASASTALGQCEDGFEPKFLEVPDAILRKDADADASSLDPDPDPELLRRSGGGSGLGSGCLTALISRRPTCIFHGDWFRADVWPRVTSLTLEKSVGGTEKRG